MNATIAKFLGALKGVRNGRRTSAQATYWAAAAALADGHEPSSKPAALAECLERIGKTDDDLAADAQRLSVLAEVERAASREPDARARLRATAIAKGDAEKRAAEFEKRARDLRDEAEASTAEAAKELDAARKAVQRVADLRLELGRAGHPDYAGEGDRRERARAVDAVETQLRVTDSELSEAELVSRSDTSEAWAARVVNLREVRARLVARLAALKAGAPLDANGDANNDNDDSDDEPLLEEVGRG